MILNSTDKGNPLFVQNAPIRARRLDGHEFTPILFTKSRQGRIQPFCRTINVKLNSLRMLIANYNDLHLAVRAGE
jgi:hypothetical protein